MGMVPVAAEVLAQEVGGVHLDVGDLDALGIGVGVEVAAHLEAGRGGGNVVDAVERRPAP